jgi:2-polyprenyl-6-methoxyphenol hydroxylase-like FAD-dependent oxidoreductase
MSDERQTDVVIVGAGPVGLTLALDLAWRGIDVVVIERRRAGEPPVPQCNHVAARTMETFRRLGVASKLRNAGLPEDYPHDIAYRTTFTGVELTRIPIPCRRERFTDKGGVDSDWPTPELPHRINQIFLEPILFGHVAAQPRVTILNRTEIESFEQNSEGVVAVLKDLDLGVPRTVTCRYLIGCDGGRSTVRRAIGAKLEGDAVVQRVQATFIRAPDLLGRLGGKPAWMNISVNPRRNGNVIAIDGRERWMIFNYLLPGEEFEMVPRDKGIRDILGVGDDFAYEVISNEDWIGRRLIADKFRDRRVFLAGDAAHIWVPYAGYGMNAGIADAMNLSWLLAAHLNGWAADTILDAYKAERWPITEQVSRFAMSHAEREIKRRGEVSPLIEAPGPEGDAVRAAAGKLAYEINMPQYAAGGLNFGYYYDASPIIAYDGETAPPYSMADFTPSTVPGCRTPHLWLDDGRSLYDALGPEYTLLRFDPAADPDSLLSAAAIRGVPMSLLDVVPRSLDRAIYREALVLSRPDGHIAWRGNRVPSDPDGLIDTITGRRRAVAAGRPATANALA